MRRGTAAAQARRHCPRSSSPCRVDCNGGYVYLDPYEGGKIAVAEAARNLACSGAVPLGVTDNLNFGNPHNPEIFWQLQESRARPGRRLPRFQRARSPAATVSLYNQSPAGPIDPTPTVAMVGLDREAGAHHHPMVQGRRRRHHPAGRRRRYAATRCSGLGGSAYLQRDSRPEDRHAAALRPGKGKGAAPRPCAR